MKMYKHIKRGTIYSIVAIGKFQCSDKNFDDKKVVIYKNISNSDVWVRPWEEFFDGRFEIISEFDEIG